MRYSGIAFAQEIARNSMNAESPFTDYMAKVVIFTLLVGFLVAVLLIGGLLILNLGLMSKRRQDHVGRRTPSDVGILKGNVYPEDAYEEYELPAEEEASRRPAA